MLSVCPSLALLALLPSLALLPTTPPTDSLPAGCAHPSAIVATMARVYADVNQNMPRSYWDYDSVNIGQAPPLANCAGVRIADLSQAGASSRTTRL
jgi:casein kinase II subunit alpha